jgi:hypothetical protein
MALWYQSLDKEPHRGFHGFGSAEVDRHIFRRTIEISHTRLMRVWGTQASAPRKTAGCSKNLEPNCYCTISLSERAHICSKASLKNLISTGLLVKRALLSCTFSPAGDQLALPSRNRVPSIK